MSVAISHSAERPYGVERVCGALAYPRSSYYERHKPAPSEPKPTKKRGPRPKLSDEGLLKEINADLASTPFSGEGHRKVWARLKVLQDIHVSRTRVLRLMRENNLLSPSRVRQGCGAKHDGKIVTFAPNVMWGTDGVRVFTLEDGWVWIFSAVDHWNAECVGWHVCKRGDRFAALEPISMGLIEQYGSVEADAARGLALRMDHGTQYLSDHFLNQIKFWGVAPSFAFVEQPQTNGVAERFNRTLKEQAVHGRIFRNVEELREAVGRFMNQYNDKWLVEKNGFKSPRRTRRDYFGQSVDQAA